LIAASFGTKIGEKIRTPFPVTIRIYEKERSKILCLVPSKLGNPYEFPEKRECFSEFIRSIKILKRLPAAELVRAMFLDDSDYFLIIILYKLQEDYAFFPFNEIWSFQRSRVEGCTVNPALKVFRNFVIFFSQSVADLKPLKLDGPSDSAVATSLLQLFQDFWHGRLKSLGKRILSTQKFKLWTQFIEDRLRFLGTFLSHKTEDLFIEVNQRLVGEIKRGIHYKSSKFLPFILPL
jgi:hypothetical protein